MQVSPEVKSLLQIFWERLVMIQIAVLTHVLAITPALPAFANVRVKLGSPLEWDRFITHDTHESITYDTYEIDPTRCLAVTERRPMAGSSSPASFSWKFNLSERVSTVSLYSVPLSSSYLTSSSYLALLHETAPWTQLSSRVQPLGDSRYPWPDEWSGVPFDSWGRSMIYVGIESVITEIEGRGPAAKKRARDLRAMRQVWQSPGYDPPVAHKQMIAELKKSRWIEDKRRSVRAAKTMGAIVISLDLVGYIDRELDQLTWISHLEQSGSKSGPVANNELFCLTLAAELLVTLLGTPESERAAVVDLLLRVGFEEGLLVNEADLCPIQDLGGLAFVRALEHRAKKGGGLFPQFIKNTGRGAAGRGSYGVAAVLYAYARRASHPESPMHDALGGELKKLSLDHDLPRLDLVEAGLDRGFHFVGRATSVGSIADLIRTARCR